MARREGGLRESGAPRVPELLEDLDTICDGPGLTLHLGREGGRVTVGGTRQPIFRKTGGRAWKKVTRRVRREMLLAWIQGAAGVTRGRLQREGAAR